MQSRKDYQF